MNNIKIENQIEELKAIFQNQVSCWKDIKELSIYLKISVSQVRKMVKENTIPYTRLNPNDLNSKLLFNKRLVDIWLLTGNIKPNKKDIQKFNSILS